MGWSAGRHVDHPCGGQISPWPASKATDLNRDFSKIISFSWTFALGGYFGRVLEDWHWF